MHHLNFNICGFGRAGEPFTSLSLIIVPVLSITPLWTLLLALVLLSWQKVTDHIKTLSLAMLWGTYGAFTLFVLTYLYIFPLSPCIYVTEDHSYFHFKTKNTTHYKNNLDILATLCLMLDYFSALAETVDDWVGEIRSFPPLLRPLIGCHPLSSSFFVCVPRCYQLYCLPPIWANNRLLVALQT